MGGSCVGGVGGGGGGGVEDPGGGEGGGERGRVGEWKIQSGARWGRRSDRPVTTRRRMGREWERMALERALVANLAVNGSREAANSSMIRRGSEDKETGRLS